MLILCLGKSYTGRYLAQNFSGIDVVWASRGSDSIAIGANGEYPSGLKLPDVILDTVPVVLDQSEIVLPYGRLVLSILAKNPRTPLLHISSTSVLGKSHILSQNFCDVPVLDENEKPEPSQARGELRLRLEQKIQNDYNHSIIVRAAGIYGPQRNLLLSFQKGDFSRVQSQNRVVSRIHVHDLCRLILQIFKNQLEGRHAPLLIHAVDTKPTPNDEVFAFIQNKLGIKIPKYQFGQHYIGRSVKSLHTNGLLGEFMYPDYKSGFFYGPPWKG